MPHSYKTFFTTFLFGESIAYINNINKCGELQELDSDQFTSTLYDLFDMQLFIQPSNRLVTPLSSGL